MNKNILFIVALLPYFLFAQNEHKGENKDRGIRPGALWYYDGLKPTESSSKRKYDRLIFDLTYNDWVGDTELFRNQWSSIGLNTNFMFDIPMSKDNTFSFGIGFSHSWVNIRHDRRLDRIDSTEATVLNEKGAFDAFDKSRFGSHSFSIPIELRYRTPAWKHFKLHVGGKIGYQTQAYTKYIGKNNDGQRTIQKTIGFEDEQQLLYSVHARIGLRNWAFYGSYALNPVFTSKNSSSLNLVQFGISLSLF